MSNEQRTDIPKSRSIRAKMTPGPWSVEESSERDGDELLYRDLSIPEIGRSLHNDEWADVKDWPRDRANAEGIVYCVNTYDALVDEVEALRAALAEAERAEKNEHAQRMRAEAKLARIQETRDTWNANSDKYKKLHVADVVADLDRALADKGTPHE